MARIWAVIDLFENVYSTLLEDKGANIDGIIMKLHHKATVMGLAVASSISLMASWFGTKAIECSTQKTKPKDFLKILDSYCWLHPTHVMEDPSYWTPQHITKNLMGIGSEANMWCNEDDDKCGQRKVKFYIWTAYFLLFQALCFYLAKFVWTRWENGALEAIARPLNDPKLDEMNEQDQEKELNKRVESVAKVIRSRTKIGKTGYWATGYIICEIILFVNIGIQWWMTKTFLGTIRHQGVKASDETLDFANLGHKFFDYHKLEASDRKYVVDPMRVMFPRQTICRMEQFGTAGHIQATNALCLLPLNVINEKIFLGLWFWLIVISTITLLNMIFRAIVVLFQSARERVLKMEIQESFSDLTKEDNPLRDVCKTHSDYLFFQGIYSNIGKKKVIMLMNAFKNDGD